MVFELLATQAVRGQLEGGMGGGTTEYNAESHQRDYKS
jgi:hypothetical protein